MIHDIAEAVRRSPDRLRRSLEERLFPDWTKDAACRNQELPGRLFRDAFTDEVGQKQDITDYRWPERTVNALKVCAACPVRRECLEAEFVSNPSPRQFGVRGGVPGRIREALGFKPCPECAGKGFLRSLTVGDTEIRWADYCEAFDADQSGFPCRNCRSTGRLADSNRIEACEQWADDLASERGWTAKQQKEEAV